MTGEDLEIFCQKQKLRRVDIAWIAGVTTRQVYFWLENHSPIPQSVELLLKAFGQGKIDARWIIRNIKKPIPD
jgi:hypothetical protein